MALIDQLIEPSSPSSCYLWPAALSNLHDSAPAIGSAIGGITGATVSNTLTSIAVQQRLDFQFWPESLQDDYQPEYAEHMIPGGTHPLYQWVGGRGRTITFQAIFVSEINTAHLTLGRLSSVDLTPSRPYTVDIVAALSRLRSWMLPKYGEGGRLGLTDPPQILKLAFGNTGLGGGSDVINVILRNAPVTYEAWFPDGQPRVATVDLTFNEIVQDPTTAGAGRAAVRFIDRTAFKKRGDRYVHRGNGSSLNPLIGGL